ncbi:hypothetical protein FDP22_22915 (plasmid) [Paroceanicella profunda]|uniref:Uncharacterized protein n=1 Tax=Paroceanicella profunda TaxID=2579971 RepID=A0A5B8FJQ5_9RHOB|nr:glycosyl hydrolase 53 family protein [Paroceanicella profunda]QDL94727.1 hypothetical protein FDP22_22915 [Paroceanicella profunda]
MRPNRWHVLLLVGGLALAAALPAPAQTTPAQTTPARPAMEYGVQMHFSQGWPLALYGRLDALGDPPIRDSLPWQLVEQAPGVFAYPEHLTAYMEALRARGMTMIMTFAHRNPLYEAGETPHGPEAYAAFAAYVVQALKDWGGLIRAVEIGNEINGNFVTGPAREDRAGTYAALLKVVYAAVKAQDPEVLVLGGATHSIPLGLFREMFEDGALDAMDGIALHPYRPVPEHVDTELAWLHDLMEAFGGAKPVYATEFTNAFETPEQAPGYMARMLALMAGAGVREAYWYALLDQEAYPNTGLIDEAGRQKPAFEAFRFLRRVLLGAGPVTRLSDDPLLHHYAFGAPGAAGRAQLIWGAPRRLALPPGAAVYAPDGTPRAGAAEILIGPEPVVVVGPETLAPEASPVLGDALLQYGGPPWEYAVVDAAGTATPLTRIDWEWTSYLGTPWSKPLRVNADSLVPGGGGAAPLHVAEIFVAPEAGPMRIDAEWRVTKDTSDGVTLEILRNGTRLMAAQVSRAMVLEDFPVTLAAGDRLEFRIGPGPTVTGDNVERRVQIRRAE